MNIGSKVSFERILLDLELGIINSTRLYFGDNKLLCREYFIKTSENKSNRIIHGNKNYIDTGHVLILYNLDCYNKINRDYNYIDGNDFILFKEGI